MGCVTYGAIIRVGNEPAGMMDITLDYGRNDQSGMKSFLDADHIKFLWKDAL